MNIRDHEVFKDCSKKIVDLCEDSFASLSESMEPDEIVKARERLDIELDIIVNCGYSPEYLISLLILKFALKENCPILIRGRCCYSYVAYLMNLVKQNPLNFPLELCFAYHHDRTPEFQFDIIKGFEEKLISFVKSLFEDEYITIRESSIVLGNKNNPNEEGWEKIYIYYCESTLLNHCIPMTGWNELYESRRTIFDMDYPTGEILPIGTNNEKIRRVIVREFYESFCTEPDIDMKCVDILDGTYEGVLHALSIMKGHSVVDSEACDHNGNKIYTVDDVYRYGRHIFSDNKKAYDFAEQIRKGRGKDPKLQKLLEVEGGVPRFNREALKIISRLVFEGSMIPLADMVMFLSMRYEEGLIKQARTPMYYSDISTNTTIKVIAYFETDDNTYVIALCGENAHLLELKTSIARDVMESIPDEIFEKYRDMVQNYELLGAYKLVNQPINMSISFGGLVMHNLRGDCED